MSKNTSKAELIGNILAGMKSDCCPPRTKCGFINAVATTPKAVTAS